VVIVAVVILARGTGYMDWVTTSGKAGGIGFWRFGPLVPVDQRRYEICVYLIDIPPQWPSRGFAFPFPCPMDLKTPPTNSKSRPVPLNRQFLKSIA
jgi:hypothetical protein